MKIAVIDNYDSFTYNLVHYLEDLGTQVTVWRNDEFDLKWLEPFPKILLSPGPGLPDEAGLLKAVIKEYATSKSILGVCLGQQAIAESFGGRLSNLARVHHGVDSTLTLTVADEPLFANIPGPIRVGRYHSWTVDPLTLPDALQITAVDENGHIMALRHKTLDVRGVQFHPESVLTPHGKQMLHNWLGKSI